MENPEKHINIHASPEMMGGVYANFGNVSHSDYEFAITFVRLEHENEDAEEVNGVVVARVNMSPKFMKELMDAMADNYSKWLAAEVLALNELRATPAITRDDGKDYIGACGAGLAGGDMRGLARADCSANRPYCLRLSPRLELQGLPFLRIFVRHTYRTIGGAALSE